MKRHGLSKASLLEKAVDELKEFVVIAAYLFVCFAAVAYFKASILKAHGMIESAPAKLGYGITDGAMVDQANDYFL